MCYSDTAQAFDALEHGRRLRVCCSINSLSQRVRIGVCLEIKVQEQQQINQRDLDTAICNVGQTRDERVVMRPDSPDEAVATGDCCNFDDCQACPEQETVP